MSSWWDVRGWFRRRPKALLASGGETSEGNAVQISRQAHEDAMRLIREIGGPDLVNAWSSGQPIYPLWGSQRSVVAEGLKASLWVYVAIEALSSAISSVPWEVVTGDRVLTDHPLARLMGRPNEQWGWPTVAKLWAQYHLLAGESYLGITRAGFATPQELWPINPAYVNPLGPDRRSADGQILTGYQYSIGGRAQTLEPSDLLPWVSPDPDRPLRGLSPLQAAAGTVNVDSKSQTWQSASLDRMAIPGGVIYDAKDYVSEEQFIATKKKLEASHMGATKARGTMFLDGGRKFEALALTPVELDLLKTQGLNRDKILSVYSVPGPVVGVYETATYNNIRTAYEQFWRFTVAGHLERMGGALNQHLVQPYWPDVVLRPNTQRIKIMRHLDLDTARTALTLRQCGVPMDVVNERLELGLRPYEGWNTAGLPASGATSTGGDNKNQ